MAADEEENVFPEDLRYTDKHEWVRAGNGGTVRIGITSFAAEALGDIVYITLPQVGEEVAADDSCAEVESTKNVSEVYAPLSGVITAVNEQLTDAPDTVNNDPFGDGWLFELELTEPGQLDDLLDADAYAAVAGE